ncbi:hypothetical protein [Methylomonas sp. YC3]
MNMPFEFCALRFLLQWERSEKSLHREMKGTPSIADIRKSLRYFQVARNFSGLKDDGRAQMVSQALGSIDLESDLTPEQKVDRLARRFKRDFNQFNLSAASKLFWLKHKRPYIIYDSRAVSALKELGHTFDKRNYAAYCKSWREQYRLDRDNIKTAASRLIEIRGFLPAWHVDEETMSKLTRQPWFLERVFDIYLWEAGGES